MRTQVPGILLWLSTLSRYWALLACLLLMAIVLVTTTNIAAFSLDRIARNWGGSVSGLPGYEDFVSLTISGVALMFFPYCQLRKGHVAVLLFTSVLPLRARLFLDALWLVLIGVVAVFLAVYMIMGMREVMTDGNLSGVLGWPEWPFYIPGILSLFLWSAISVSQAFYPQFGADHHV